MKIFEIGSVYKDTFGVFGADGSPGTLTFPVGGDGISVVSTEDSTTTVVTLADSAGDNHYNIIAGHDGKIFIQITLTDSSLAEGELYNVIVFGTVTDSESNTARLEGAVVKEFAIAPYGSVNMTHINSEAVVEDVTPDVNVTEVASSPVVDMWATVADLPSEPLDEEGIRTAVGMASANLDTILAEIDTDVQAILQIEQGKAVIADEGGTLVLRIYDKDESGLCVAAWELKDINGADVTMTDPFAQRNPTTL